MASPTSSVSPLSSPAAGPSALDHSTSRKLAAPSSAPSSLSSGVPLPSSTTSAIASAPSPSSSNSAAVGTSSSSSLGDQVLFQGGDALKLKRELTRGVWLAELNGALVKIALTFIQSADEREEKRTPDAKKAKKQKKSKKNKKYGKEEEHEPEEADEADEGEVVLAPGQAIPEEVGERLSADVEALRAELAAVRLELDLSLRAWHEDFAVEPQEARQLPLALRLHASPDEIMFEKMLEAPYVATVGFKKNVPDVVGKVTVGVQASEAKQRAVSEATSATELALAPRGDFCYRDLLLPEFNLNAVREVDLSLLGSLRLDVLQWLDADDAHYTRLLAMHMFAQLGLVQHFNMDERKLWRFLVSISAKYRRVPFHSWFHAFNVTQTLFFFLTTCNAQHLLGPLELLALLVAALSHDADHPGLNNSFHGKAQTRIAVLHKKSTLENHHLLNAYHVLSRPECNILEHVSAADKDQFMRYLRDLILATDLSLHGIILRNMDDCKKQLGKQFGKTRPQLSDEERIVVMCCLMKCADLSNEIRPTEVAQRWAKMVITEFFAQSDKERELELPVTPFMDREKIIIANEQINFITKLCSPLYAALQAVYPGMVVCLDQMKSNLKNWNQRLSSFYNKDEEKAKLSNKSIWERDQVKEKDAKAKLSDVLGKQSSGAAPK